MSPAPLSVALVLELHAEQLRLFGGRAGIADQGKLESALAQPTAVIFGEQRYSTPWLQAAAYLHFVSQAHAFVDANKRTALACCLIWLGLHGLETWVPIEKLADLVVESVRDHWEVEHIAHVLQQGG